MFVSSLLLLFCCYILEGSGEGDVRSGIGRNLTAHSARADEACAVASISCSHPEPSHRIAHARIVVMHLRASVIVHIACIHAPVRRKAHFEQCGHPVFLISLRRQVLEFQAGRECGCPFVEQVCNHGVELSHFHLVPEPVLFLAVVFLRRVQNQIESGGRLFIASIFCQSIALVYFSTYLKPLCPRRSATTFTVAPFCSMFVAKLCLAQCHVICLRIPAAFVHFFKCLRQEV